MSREFSTPPLSTTGVDRNGSSLGRRSVVSRVCAGLAAVAILASGLVLAQTPRSAEAAPGPNPNVDIAVTKTFDGTGHGTAAASFVNSANGFSPGDDTASDGVVSSNDVVGYEVDLRIKAGPVRTVAVKMAASGMLAWETGKADFCAPTRGVLVEVSGDTCLMTVAAGATAQIKRTLLMTAKDTAGAVVRDQKLSVEIGLRSQQPYAIVASEATTVVSAPSTDLTITPSQPHRAYRWEHSADGAFLIDALPLTRPGFAPLKGAATAGNWTARVDVSSFPVDTVWNFAGTSPTRDSNGWLTLGPTTGSGTLNFSIPGGWPAQPEGESKRYDARLEVPDTAFASADFRNNGTGWQPGTGEAQRLLHFRPRCWFGGRQPVPKQ